ncbi:hypothetical protein SUGI_1085570 [Cryptomeria japonica]|nr:hypothetical protein SUGI_1085570 [Cryptomeria japonica]
MHPYCFVKQTPAALAGSSMMVFDFAHKHERSYINSLKSAFCPFLCAYSGYQDELLRGAAIWLLSVFIKG